MNEPAALRDLPPVDALASDLAAETGLPRVVCAALARDALQRARASIRTGTAADPVGEARRLATSMLRRRPQRVINATGVLLHTNLGRATVAPAAAEAAAAALASYGNLELDLTTGSRGGRAGYVRSLIAAVTGAEDALIVNNNAGAMLLALAALSGGGRVAVSRGELIEIGGSFRLPDVMAASGALLHEVGTTNRTRTADYERAAGSVAAFLKVHPSNYRVVGFTEEAGYADLAAVAVRAGVPFIADVGSGLLDTRTPWLDGAPPGWLAGEPGVRQTLEDGASVVLFSGDKLLGGPQAGIAAGDAAFIAAMARHPIARAVRADAATLAALGATVELYASGRGGEIPFWTMASLPYDALERRAKAVAEGTADAAVVRGASVPGAGSAPGATIDSPVVRMAGRGDPAWRRLLDRSVPIVARRDEGDLIVDLRTVDPEDDAVVAEALAAALS